MILKHSCAPIRYIKVADEFRIEDGIRIKGPFHRIGRMYPHRKLNADQAKQVKWLPLIAHLAKRHRIELLCHFETFWEFRSLPKTDDQPLYGARIRHVKNPFEYHRIVAGTENLCPLKYPKLGWAKSRAVECFEKVDDARFLELQRICGAYQGENTGSPNQLLDAFHILCAERAGADFFLTCEKKLVRCSNHPRFGSSVRIVEPQTFVKELVQARPSLIVDALWFALNYRFCHSEDERLGRG